MCKICGTTPCDSRCPNAHEPESAYTCKKCKDELCIGDKYAEIGRERYCKGCLENMSTEDLVELLGGSWQTVDETDIDDGSDAAYERLIDERLGI